MAWEDQGNNPIKDIKSFEEAVYKPGGWKRRVKRTYDINLMDMKVTTVKFEVSP